MTFTEWIDAHGVPQVAQLLCVTAPTVRHWKAGHAYPKVSQMKTIKKLSKGVIGYDEIIDNPNPRGWGKSAGKSVKTPPKKMQAKDRARA